MRQVFIAVSFMGLSAVEYILPIDKGTQGFSTSKGRACGPGTDEGVRPYMIFSDAGFSCGGLKSIYGARVGEQVRRAAAGDGYF